MGTGAADSSRQAEAKLKRIGTQPKNRRTPQRDKPDESQKPRSVRLVPVVVPDVLLDIVVHLFDQTESNQTWPQPRPRVRAALGPASSSKGMPKGVDEFQLVRRNGLLDVAAVRRQAVAPYHLEFGSDGVRSEHFSLEFRRSQAGRGQRQQTAVAAGGEALAKPRRCHLLCPFFRTKKEVPGLAQCGGFRQKTENPSDPTGWPLPRQVLAVLPRKTSRERNTKGAGRLSFARETKIQSFPAGVRRAFLDLPLARRAEKRFRDDRVERGGAVNCF